MSKSSAGTSGTGGAFKSNTDFIGKKNQEFYHKDGITCYTSNNTGDQNDVMDGVGGSRDVINIRVACSCNLKQDNCGNDASKVMNESTINTDDNLCAAGKPYCPKNCTDDSGNQDSSRNSFGKKQKSTTSSSDTKRRHACNGGGLDLNESSSQGCDRKPVASNAVLLNEGLPASFDVNRICDEHRAFLCESAEMLKHIKIFDGCDICELIKKLTKKGNPQILGGKEQGCNDIDESRWTLDSDRQKPTGSSKRKKTPSTTKKRKRHKCNDDGYGVMEADQFEYECSFARDEYNKNKTTKMFDKGTNCDTLGESSDICGTDNDNTQERLTCCSIDGDNDDNCGLVVSSDDMLFDCEMKGLSYPRTSTPIRDVRKDVCCQTDNNDTRVEQTDIDIDLESLLSSLRQNDPATSSTQPTTPDSNSSSTSSKLCIVRTHGDKLCSATCIDESGRVDECETCDHTVSGDDDDVDSDHCGLEDSYKKQNYKIRSNSDEEINEQIMRKQEEIWGDNIPPDFIIKGTKYAKRHQSCCVDNVHTCPTMYICPKNVTRDNSNKDDCKQNSANNEVCNKNDTHNKPDKVKRNIIKEGIMCKPSQYQSETYEPFLQCDISREPSSTHSRKHNDCVKPDNGQTIGHRRRDKYENEDQLKQKTHSSHCRKSLKTGEEISTPSSNGNTRTKSHQTCTSPERSRSSKDHSHKKKKTSSTSNDKKLEKRPTLISKHTSTTSLAALLSEISEPLLELKALAVSRPHSSNTSLTMVLLKPLNLTTVHTATSTSSLDSTRQRPPSRQPSTECKMTSTTPFSSKEQLLESQPQSIMRTTKQTSISNSTSQYSRPKDRTFNEAGSQNTNTSGSSLTKDHLCQTKTAISSQTSSTTLQRDNSRQKAQSRRLSTSPKNTPRSSSHKEYSCHTNTTTDRPTTSESNQRCSPGNSCSSVKCTPTTSSHKEHSCQTDSITSPSKCPGSSQRCSPRTSTASVKPESTRSQKEFCCQTDSVTARPKRPVSSEKYSPRSSTTSVKNTPITSHKEHSSQKDSSESNQRCSPRTSTTSSKGASTTRSQDSSCQTDGILVQPKRPVSSERCSPSTSTTSAKVTPILSWRKDHSCQTDSVSQSKSPVSNLKDSPRTSRCNTVNNTSMCNSLKGNCRQSETECPIMVPNSSSSFKESKPYPTCSKSQVELSKTNETKKETCHNCSKSDSIGGCTCGNTSTCECRKSSNSDNKTECTVSLSTSSTSSKRHKSSTPDYKTQGTICGTDDAEQDSGRCCQNSDATEGCSCKNSPSSQCKQIRRPNS